MDPDARTYSRLCRTELQLARGSRQQWLLWWREGVAGDGSTVPPFKCLFSGIVKCAHLPVRGSHSSPPSLPPSANFSVTLVCDIAFISCQHGHDPPVTSCPSSPTTNKLPSYIVIKPQSTIPLYERWIEKYFPVFFRIDKRSSIWCCSCICWIYTRKYLVLSWW